MEKLFLTLFGCFLFFKAATAECASTATVLSYEVSDCANERMCPLKRGHDATIKIEFIPEEEIHGLKTVVHGVIGGIPMPFPMPHTDACDGAGLECPLRSNETYTYLATIPVKPLYPPVKVNVKWQLVKLNEDGEEDGDSICIMIPAKIV